MAIKTTAGVAPNAATAIGFGEEVGGYYIIQGTPG